MHSYVLHGLWLPVSGLCLWIERTQGHRIVLPSSIPPGTFSPAVEELIDSVNFGPRVRVTLQTPRGKERSLLIPVANCSSGAAVRIFEALEAARAADAPVADAQAADAPADSEAKAAQYPGVIGADLAWLVHAFLGVRSFVRAGRVVPRVKVDRQGWVPAWQLASSSTERRWISALMAAAPAVLSINNRQLERSIVDDLAHEVAFDLLAHHNRDVRGAPWHPLVYALITGSALSPRGRSTFLRDLNRWKDTVNSRDINLVLMISEPLDEVNALRPGEVPRAHSGAAAESLISASAATEIDTEPTATGIQPPARWPVQVMLREDQEAPRPVVEKDLDQATLEQLANAWRLAQRTSSILASAEAITSGHSYAAAGDWDVVLATEDVVRFVRSDVERLRRAGITVMLPRAWAHTDTQAWVETKEATSTSAVSRMTMNTVVDYNWRISVGDMDLTDEEMAALVSSKSGLVQLRGQWVMADTATLGKVAKYMETFAQPSDSDAPATDSGAEGLAADLTEPTAQRASMPRIAGQATINELRALYLNSTADLSVEIQGPAWQQALESGMDTRSPQRVEIPDTVHAQLREYQRRGVDWMYWMTRNGVGAVLADDMGLGKTLQVLALQAVEKSQFRASGASTAASEVSEDNPQPWPTLVIVPTSVVGNWAREAARFVPSLRVLVHHGAERLSGAEFHRTVLHPEQPVDLVVTSYGTLTRDHQLLASINWFRVILDEAQAIKNPSTQAAKIARSLPSHHRLALTGTPVENSLSELHSILDFCNPGMLGSATFFRQHFARPIEREKNDDIAERLRTLTSAFILRRLKTDQRIIDDLPDKVEQVLRVPLSAEQAALYDAFVRELKTLLEDRDGMKRRGLILASLTRIKQICNHPAHFLGDGSAITEGGVHRSGKVEKLIELIDAAMSQGERMLIFTQYRAFGELLVPYLSNHLGVSVPFLHGGVAKARRDAMVADFQAEHGAPVMLLSLKAGGTGLNLTAANIVVHLDRWWNPAVENQATDRAFRIGQQRDVRVYKMVTIGTLEESIQEVLDDKRQLADVVVGEGEGWLTNLPTDQLMELMDYRHRSQEMQSPGDSERAYAPGTQRSGRV